ncbi:zinc finger protein CONSTANS-LIKE 13 isoform X1 [Phoenix dactylifera]|uniref:Zinc finger protein CONSTANS-LIKE 13 isoform X1 n=1 Tax=Phoenix dactylifera TaxID=42345 RepID=A0A8B7CIW4_PHODC|nr:zinc finger protein CONSTANS-LIKE 13 isoform X1 [Phoenix dactylifera]
MGQEEAAKAVDKVERDEGREGEEEEKRKEDSCDFCGEAKALVYCRADAARLCLRCDRQVHAANSVCSRHPRSLLCDTCRAAAASIFCPSHRSLLCSNCDFDAHRGGGVVHQDRRPVESFSGCPTAAELVAVLGVGEDAKSVVEGTGDDGGGGWLVDDGWMWEMPPVFSLDDLIVPTTSCHGFQATGIPPLPKHRNSTCGKHKEEIVRQLHELIKSENRMINDHDELEQVMKFQTLVPQQNFQLGNLHSDVAHDGTCIAVPACEFQDNAPQWTTDKLAAVFPVEQDIGDSSMVNLLSVDETTDNQANANKASVADSDTGHTVIRQNIPSLPLKSGNELAFVNRDSVISRYKKKRETRRYDKLIRYESRKIRADTRMRIKGRFAKANQVTQLETDQTPKLGD